MSELRKTRRRTAAALVERLSQPIPELGAAFAETKILKWDRDHPYYLASEIESQTLLERGLEAHFNDDQFDVLCSSYLDIYQLDELASFLEKSYKAEFEAEHAIQVKAFLSSDKRQTTREERKAELKEKLHDKPSFEKVLMCLYALPALKHKIKLQTWKHNGTDYEYFQVGKGKIHTKLYLFCEDGEVRQAFDRELNPGLLYATPAWLVACGRGNYYYDDHDSKLFLQFIYKLDPELFQSTLEDAADEIENHHIEKRRRDDLANQINARRSMMQHVADNVTGVIGALVKERTKASCSGFLLGDFELQLGLPNFHIGLNTNNIDMFNSELVVSIVQAQCQEYLAKIGQVVAIDKESLLEACQFGITYTSGRWGRAPQEITIDARLFALMFDTTLAPVYMCDPSENVRAVAIIVEEANRQGDKNEEVS